MENKGPGLAVLLSVLIALTWITSILRFYVRYFILKAFWIDDWLMAITLASNTFWHIDQLIGIHYGVGRHMKDLTLPQIHTALAMFWGSELGYIATTTLLKLALGTLILRVAMDRTHILIIRIVMVVSTVYGVAFFFVAMFQCHPISDFWNKLDTGNTCIAGRIISDLTYTHSAISVISDWILVALPIQIIMASYLDRRSKILAVCTVAFGAIGSTATIVRIPVIKILDSSKADFLYTCVNLVVFSSVEGGVGLIAGNVVTLRPLFKSLSNLATSRSQGETKHTENRTSESRTVDVDVEDCSQKSLAPTEKHRENSTDTSVDVVDQ
ncbi:hypothetical protein BP6252_11104 [Coleophoma cylindrospora]|uniref:Rhodopsin domain-containing protein n=1 Tax=Coleophoma cylindrospora TaxID=1849047 RepID=A0A3D8QP37_9HELO|nr:hypothetical protein BP6252_11104 [Coleophoma cylindrospora]